MNLLIDGKMKKRNDFDGEKVEIQATVIRVKMQLCGIIPSFRMDRLSTEITTKSVGVQRSYSGRNLANFSDTDVLEELISKLIRKVLHEEKKIDRTRKAYAEFIAAACSKTHKP